jgi:hypothetical protein
MTTSHDTYEYVRTLESTIRDLRTKGNEMHQRIYWLDKIIENILEVSEDPEIDALCREALRKGPPRV